MIHYLHELKPFTICRTKHSDNPKTYICLANDNDTHTVYTTEENGFVMTALNMSTSKRVQVEIIYAPEGNPESLFEIKYPQEYEELRRKAIEWLYKNEKRLKKENKKQILQVLFRVKEYENKNINKLDRIITKIKSGNEKLTFKNNNLEFSLIDFWRWSVSDILSNATRGIFAEFIVATAAKINLKEVRDEWGAFDLITSEGIKIEVKSSAYIQTWFQKALSKISFSIKPSFVIDAITNKLSEFKIRSADVYVFCLLHHENKLTVEPLNLDHWEFYVLATEQLNNYTRSQHSITLNSIKKITNSVDYENLGDEIKTKNSLNKKSPDSQSLL